MTPWLLLGVTVVIGVWAFVRSERARTRSVLALASKLESRGEYEAACFHYAVASNAGAKRSECEAKVRALWAQHGPFDFSGMAEELRYKYCSYEVTESQYRKERSFVDADEIPELLKGFDALLKVKANPTPFKSFAVRYTTKGDLQLTAFNASNGSIMFAVQTGRTLKAQRIGLGVPDMQKLRGLFEAAAQKLSTLGPPK